MKPLQISASLQDYSKYTGSEYAIIEAGLNGLMVHLPAENELLLDLDSLEEVEVFRKRFRDFLNLYPGTIMRLLPSKTKGHMHAIVEMQAALTAEQRIILQLCLGSHYMREFLSYQRVLANDPNPTLLIRPKETA